MDLVAYTRVSTVGQIDGWGLAKQKSAIKEWAAREGHTIVRWFKDAGVSGTVPALERDGMRDAILHIADGKSAGLVVAELDRFARELMVQESALEVIWRFDAAVFTATSGEVQRDDPNDPARTLIRQVLGAVAEFEKRHLVMRLRHGRETKIAAGGKGSGAYPFGWERRGREVVHRPAEQATVRRIIELRRGGMSYRKIAATLDSECRPSRYRRPWSAMAVRSVVIREQGAA